MKQYTIPFSGLKLGKHHFDFEVGKPFFDEFEYSLVKSGQLEVSLELDKQETMMILDFNIKGSINLTCDRCLGEYPQQIDVDDRLIAKFSEDKELEDTTEEVIVLTKNDVEIDVSGFLYEMINLAVPYINVCENSGGLVSCDEEMIARLKELSVNEANDNNEKTDPRWEALKNIKNN